MAGKTEKYYEADVFYNVAFHKAGQYWNQHPPQFKPIL